MSSTFDFAVTDVGGQIVALIDVKGQTSPWNSKSASEYRRNLILAGLRTIPSFSLFLTPEKGYFWKGAASATAEHLPQIEFLMEPIISRYAGSERMGELSRETLEAAIFQWLLHLIWLTPNSPLNKPESELRDSGFLEAIRGGTVLSEARVG